MPTMPLSDITDVCRFSFSLFRFSLFLRFLLLTLIISSLSELITADRRYYAFATIFSRFHAARLISHCRRRRLSPLT